jgi:molybdate transport system substrate-binding protein
VSELLPVPGIAHITPLPPELQKISTFAACVAASCPDPSLARAVIEFLASPRAADAIRNSGLQIGLQSRPDQLPLIGPGAPPSKRMAGQ